MYANEDKDMNTEQILKQNVYYTDKSVKDLIYECLDRENVVKSPNDLDCENYFEQNFAIYPSKKEFAFGISKDNIEAEIERLFKTPNDVPWYLIKAIIDDFFTIGFGIHGFDIITENYKAIETEEGYYVINIEDLTYDISDVLDYVNAYITDYEELVTRIKDYLDNSTLQK